jgi:hypothetical protein
VKNAADLGEDSGFKIEVALFIFYIPMVKSCRARLSLVLRARK